MTIDALKNALPDYAKDIKLNLSTLAGEDNLTLQQLWGCFFVSALASRNAQTIEWLMADAVTHLSETALQAAKTAAAIMAMNNVYYRFVHLSSNQSYHTMPAKLRMNALANPGVEKVDFELWSLAVSAINGCGMCIDSHEAELRKHGLTDVQVQTAIRIASAVHAAACVFEAEQVMSKPTALAAAA